VMVKRKGQRVKVRRYATLAGAERRLLLYGPEPWLYARKGPDDLFCCRGGPECDCHGMTMRERSEEVRGELPALEYARIESRAVGEWEAPRA
jgi:hypothetical protein